MVVRYIHNALRHAEYKTLEDGTWFASIPGFDGVWANAATVEDCREELEEVLGEWLVLKIRDGDPLPAVDGLQINIREKVAA